MLCRADGGPATFSHKRHAPLRLACLSCHTAAQKAERANYPSVPHCMACHQTLLRESPAIQRLAALPAGAKLFPSQQKKSLPDFVFFSHAHHGTAGVTCANCHGAVFEQDSLPEAPRTMKACVDCHKAEGATVACNACHELSQ